MMGYDDSNNSGNDLNFYGGDDNNDNNNDHQNNAAFLQMYEDLSYHINNVDDHTTNNQTTDDALYDENDMPRLIHPADVINGYDINYTPNYYPNALHDDIRPFQNVVLPSSKPDTRVQQQESTSGDSRTASSSPDQNGNTLYMQHQPTLEHNGDGNYSVYPPSIPGPTLTQPFNMAQATIGLTPPTPSSHALHPAPVQSKVVKRQSNRKMPAARNTNGHASGSGSQNGRAKGELIQTKVPEYAQSNSSGAKFAKMNFRRKKAWTRRPKRQIEEDRRKEEEEKHIQRRSDLAVTVQNEPGNDEEFGTSNDDNTSNTNAIVFPGPYGSLFTDLDWLPTDANLSL